MVLLSDKHPIDLTIGQELPPTFHYAWVILTLSVLEADMRDAETLTMSAKELDRLEIIGRVVERRLTQRTAADRLGLILRLW